MEVKLYENEVIEDLPLFPAPLEEGAAPMHDHDGFNSEFVSVSSLTGGVFQMFFNTTAPTSGMVTGDYWIDSDDNKMYRWSGSAWGEIQDDDIATALSDAAAAQATADGKIVTFIQASAPTAEGTGDLWIDSDDGNKLYRWSGAAWGEVQDDAIAQALADAATAQSEADRKIITFIQASTPTAEQTGDLWIDSDDGNKQYRWSSSSWDEIQDDAISTALADAATAQAEADRKIVTFIQTSSPTAEQTGDIWIDSDDDNKPYRWSGSAWVETGFDVASWSKVLDDGNKPDDGADVTGDNISADTALVNAILAAQVQDRAEEDYLYGLYRGKYDDSFTEVVSNSTTTRNLLTTSISFSTGSTGWRLFSGVLGKIATSLNLTWQKDYEFFVRLKSDIGRTWFTSTQGRGYFWGLTESAFNTLVQLNGASSKGMIFDEALVGFYVAGDNKLYAISGNGIEVTDSEGKAGMDVTDLSAHNHAIFHNYLIRAHYAASVAISNSGFIRPTAHVGGNADQALMYDANTNTFGWAERLLSMLDHIGLSWNGGTTYTATIPNSVETGKTVVTLGGQYDTWGRTWSPSDFSDANFRLKLGSKSSSILFGATFNNSITFDTFGFSTGSWVEISGIEIELTSETEDEGDGGVDEHKIYDIRVKIYFTTAANTKYNKFYIDDVLVATHRTSVAIGTEEPVMMFAGGPNGRNESSGKHIFYNNYRTKVL